MCDGPIETHAHLSRSRYVRVESRVCVCGVVVLALALGVRACACSNNSRHTHSHRAKLRPVASESIQFQNEGSALRTCSIAVAVAHNYSVQPEYLLKEYACEPSGFFFRYIYICVVAVFLTKVFAHILRCDT